MRALEPTIGFQAGHYVIGFDAIDRAQVAAVGAKGAHLGELSRIEGIRVPAGFCVTTHAFQRIVAEAPSIDELLERISRLGSDDRDAIRIHSAELRQTIERIAIPSDLAAAITSAVARLGEQSAYAVRSSATAEDLPTTSFAGQHDTYLNVAGPASILQHVSRCWASLFTERAVTYRQRNGFDHRNVHMAVIVQQMVFPHAAGILFTADPLTGNRTVSSIDASFGLGQALVSGLVNADVYKVRDDEIVGKRIASKRLSIVASPDGGTDEHAIERDREQLSALTDEQIVRLAQLGRRIEAHLGRPQDIEWCLAGDDFYIVQSRPITTLFPIPEVGDAENHVYVSVGHQQMMTDAMKPLGLSFWQMTTPRPMSEAGGRLFVDVTPILASPASHAGTVALLGKSDPLITDALQSILDRGDFIKPLPYVAPDVAPVGDVAPPIETGSAIAAESVERSEESLATLKRAIRMKSGSGLLDFIHADLQELKRILFHPESHRVIMAGMEATWWLNDQLEAWLGEKRAADALTQSVSNNVTSEMGLALLGVADVIRPHADVVAFLRNVMDANFLDELPRLQGGQAARDAIQAWLDKYGMRGAGEIDITRTRWSERPDTLVPLILSHIRNVEPGDGERRFEHGRREAAKKEQDLLEQLRALPDGGPKAEQTKRMIDRVRTFAGYREYPKFGMVSRYCVYKAALLREAERLVQARVIRESEDIFYLRFQELQEVVRTNEAKEDLIRERKDAYRSYQALTPPRVLTSDGESLSGTYRRDDLPAGALLGLPVSAGTIEGRARVILDMAQADLEPGDILVTAYTDPSWTALFVAIKGLVTEVGGLMTHGAVIAREYGLPAVVGVERATRLIQDGQRIRVNGTDGYVEIMP
ncbi:MAG: rifamycin-inactivating phosphotransferase [bacterium]